MNLKNPFTKHPNSVGETYFQHMWNALKYSIRLEILALYVFIHAIFPFWNEFTASDEIEKLNKELLSENSLPINVGIGLNTGDVVVGNMGSDQRFDYSCLGDAVNLAARLEGQSKEYGLMLIIGEDTAKDMEKEFVLVELDTIAVKGKTEPVKIYTSIGTYKELNNTMNWHMAQRQHEKFLGWYRSQAWGMARKWIDDLRNEFNGVMVGYYDMMEKRINQLEQEDLPDDWDGVYRATTK